MATPRKIELLSPAANADVAIQAILHGADAVYMGAPSHGARKDASNSINEIKRAIDFAHTFRAKVYVTVNTIVYENELKSVEKMCREIYEAGADAIIVQDMSLLRMDIPPIALHASTQCDTRTAEKALFLEKVGFSQIVLARELTLNEIKHICDSVSVPIECFIHGALCVSYSGRCHMSQACRGRSANRGECSQMCRLPYTLKDSKGHILVRDKFLLSMRDLNQYDMIEDLLSAGVSSLKIEGRLKDASYVKNVTAAYSHRLNEIIEANPDKYCRASYGKSDISFEPALDKSFNRGFTHYFLVDRSPKSIASIHTPKSIGEEIKDTTTLNNGDGVSFFNEKGEYTGVGVNKIVNGTIITSNGYTLPKGIQLFRTSNVKWDKLLSKNTASRKIDIDISIDEEGITAIDERGIRIRIRLDVTKDIASKPFSPEIILSKLGNTCYNVKNFVNNLNPSTFIPASQLNSLKAELIRQLDLANLATYKYDRRPKEDKNAAYVTSSLDFHENVANSFSESFFSDHNAVTYEKAMEVERNKVIPAGTVVMTSRHCILRELGRCLRKFPGKTKLPLTITSGRDSFNLNFDCENCEMKVTT